MNSDNIEIAPFDNLLVYKNGYTPEFVFKTISHNQLGGLRIFSILKDDKVETISFLKDYTFLEKLDITASSDFDFSFLDKLSNLKKLSINVEGNNEIDLSAQVKLEYFSIKWRRSIQGLDRCEELSSLCLIDFNEPDLLKINNLENLINIRIKGSSVQSLNGLQNLFNLQSLSIGSCKKLQSINAINHLPKLKEIYFEMCPNIGDYDKVMDLPALEILGLIDCGQIQSLKFIELYQSLVKLSLLGNTVILDGDLVPARRIKSLEHRHYSHYNIKLENPSYSENVKNNLAKIKGWLK